jgi:hypothetical protein
VPRFAAQWDEFLNVRTRELKPRPLSPTTTSAHDEKESYRNNHDPDGSSVIANLDIDDIKNSLENEVSADNRR